MQLIQRKMATENLSEDVHFLNRAIKHQQQGIFDMDDAITETYTMIIGVSKLGNATIR